MHDLVILPDSGSPSCVCSILVSFIQFSFPYIMFNGLLFVMYLFRFYACPFGSLYSLFELPFNLLLVNIGFFWPLLNFI